MLSALKQVVNKTVVDVIMTGEIKLAEIEKCQRKSLYSNKESVCVTYKLCGVTKVEFLEQRKTVRNEVDVSAIDRTNVGTNERGQSCNL